MTPVAPSDPSDPSNPADPAHSGPPETEGGPEFPPESANESPPDDPPPPTLFWWVRHLVGVGLSGVFLAFGVEVLIAAYDLNDPFFFVMTFFSANFMILLSAALVVGLAWRMVDAWRGST